MDKASELHEILQKIDDGIQSYDCCESNELFGSIVAEAQSKGIEESELIILLKNADSIGTFPSLLKIAKKNSRYPDFKI